MTLDSADLSECPQCHSSLESSRFQESLFCSVCRFPLMLVAGKYRLERVLSEGGVGLLYLARHIGLTMYNQRVVKVLKRSHFEQRGAKERFWREVQLTANLSEKNVHIVRVYDDFGEENHLGLYYVMEYLRGQSLEKLLVEKEPMEYQLAFHIFAQICSAVGDAHRAAVIHRDLKPENIFLIQRGDNDHFVKIIDFGLARPTDKQSNITQGIFGTPAYMSPEQCKGEKPDTRTDIYSMGVLFYEMLTGELPFDAPRSETMSLLIAHLSQTPRPLTELRPEMPLGLEQALSRALTKDSFARFDTAEEFWEAVEPFSESLGNRPARPIKPRPTLRDPVFVNPALLNQALPSLQQIMQQPKGEQAPSSYELESKVSTDSELESKVSTDSELESRVSTDAELESRVSTDAELESSVGTDSELKSGGSTDYDLESSVSAELHDAGMTIVQTSVPDELLQEALHLEEGQGADKTDVAVVALSELHSDSSVASVDLETILFDDDFAGGSSSQELLEELDDLETNLEIPTLRASLEAPYDNGDLVEPFENSLMLDKTSKSAVPEISDPLEPPSIMVNQANVDDLNLPLESASSLTTAGKEIRSSSSEIDSLLENLLAEGESDLRSEQALPPRSSGIGWIPLLSLLALGVVALFFYLFMRG